MAQTTARSSDTDTSRDSPVLRPGRPADPGGLERAVPAAPADREAGTTGPATEEPVAEDPAEVEPAATDGDDDGDPAAQAESEEVERRYAESHQRRLRRLLRQCERVNLMDFNVLSLSGWPDSYTLNAARKRRDSWLLSATVAALVFLSGMTGFVPAWIAGGGFGAFMVILLMGVPFIRRLYSSRPAYLELILYRQQLLRDARRHVAHLEGEVGLIWQCNELSDFNPALASPRFSTLRHLSEQRRLAGSLGRREHIRLYLIYMLEAEKAYQRMQNAFFEGHQKAINRGWHTVARAMTDSAADGGEADHGPGQAQDINAAGNEADGEADERDVPRDNGRA